jgi:hypothetical protein
MIFAVIPGTVGSTGWLGRWALGPTPPLLEGLDVCCCGAELDALAPPLPFPPPPAANAPGAPHSAPTARIGRMKRFSRKSFSFVGLRG